MKNDRNLFKIADVMHFAPFIYQITYISDTFFLVARCLLRSGFFFLFSSSVHGQSEHRFFETIFLFIEFMLQIRSQMHFSIHCTVHPFLVPFVSSVCHYRCAAVIVVVLVAVVIGRCYCCCHRSRDMPFIRPKKKFVRDFEIVLWGGRLPCKCVCALCMRCSEANMCNGLISDGFVFIVSDSNTTDRAKECKEKEKNRTECTRPTEHVS